MIFNLFRKKEEAEEEKTSIVNLKKERKLTTQWNDGTADWEYLLWERSIAIYDNGEKSPLEWHTWSRGQREWAKRIADHYNIKLPNEEQHGERGKNE